MWQLGIGIKEFESLELLAEVDGTDSAIQKRPNFTDIYALQDQSDSQNINMAQTHSKCKPELQNRSRIGY